MWEDSVVRQVNVEIFIFIEEMFLPSTETFLALYGSGH